MRSSQLRTLIATKFNGYNVYYGDNTGNYDDFDYKVNYQINNVSIDDNVRIFIVDFDIWSNDSVVVEQTAETIEDILKFKTFDFEENLALFIPNTQYSNDEKNIYRRTLTFEVRTYDKEKEY